MNSDKGVLALGLMSGTSADGVSAALVVFQKKSYSLCDYKTFPYARKLSEKILQAAELKTPAISSLNFELGHLFADCALKMLKKNNISPQKVKVIGSHGQTIFHAPHGDPPNTLQIGEASIIAEKTGITTVADFRPQDIASGGEGAPLIPFFDHYFFGNSSARVLQNIGGIANVTAVGKNISRPISFDTGPGNCLIDWAITRISNGRYAFDKNGKLAVQGIPDKKIAESMFRHPYFSRKPPKSAGREIFNENFVPKSLKSSLRRNPPTALATLTYFTALTIAESYKRFVFPRYRVKEIIVSGGGAQNKTLMNYLKELLFLTPVVSIDSYGIPAQAKEPIAFAFFALRAIQGKTNHLGCCTGAKRDLVLGKIIPGKNSIFY